jgi:hypothetical protein
METPVIGEGCATRLCDRPAGNKRHDDVSAGPGLALPMRCDRSDSSHRAREDGAAVFFFHARSHSMNDDLNSGTTDEHHGRSIPGRGDKFAMLDSLRESLNPRVDKAIDRTATKAVAVVDATAGAAHKAIDYVAAKVAPVPDKTRQVLATATGKAKDASSKAVDLHDEWVHRARSEVRRKPLTALGIGAVLGVAIAWIGLRRR